MRKISIITLFCVMAAFALPLFSVEADAYSFEPEDVTIYSEAAYLENMETGEVIYSKKADEKRVPASLTKIMTCVLVLDQFKENLEDLTTTKVTATEAAFTELYDTGYSNAGIEAGDELTYYDLLCALMIPSACEAANILAIDVSGSIDDFVTLMNSKAKELGMTNTTYYNAHGLDLDGQESNITTCTDLAILCRYAINTYPVFTQITSMYSYTMSNDTTITTTNKLLDSSSEYYYGYVDGIKTGYLDSAGRCLASVAEKNGYQYLCITMGAEGYDDDGNAVYYNCADHKALYMWAYENLSYQTFVAENEEVTSTEVAYADGDGYVNLKAQDEISAIWLNDVSIDELEKKITIYDNIVAPIYAGDTLGTIQFYYDGQLIVESNLVATTDVDKAVVKAKATVAANFFSSTQFRIAIIVISVIIIVYTCIFLIYVHSRSKKKVSAIKEKYKALEDDDDE
ncbi:MAG: D-alanyl-D-alanine carboxypeptidase [Ruminococcus sp.]|nr:D-alanyl-D-alanine carboxypeptidase [Ruminococcus sp.]